MTRKSIKSADQTSFGTPGTTETPEAVRSPPMELRGNPPSAIVYAVPEFIWGMSGIATGGCHVKNAFEAPCGAVRWLRNRNRSFAFLRPGHGRVQLGRRREYGLAQ